jgi:TusA-related sulfurtransferase
MGKRPRLGTKAKVLVESKEELLRYVRRAFDFYVAQGRKKERFGHTLDRIGVDTAFAAIFSGNAEKASVDAEAEAPTASEAKRNFLDLRGVSCPLNFVKAKLAIDRIKSGEAIEFYLDDGEPIVNVTRSLKDEGHQILLVIAEKTFFKVLVEKQ